MLKYRNESTEMKLRKWKYGNGSTEVQKPKYGSYRNNSNNNSDHPIIRTRAFEHPCLKLLGECRTLWGKRERLLDS